MSMMSGCTAAFYRISCDAPFHDVGCHLDLGVTSEPQDPAEPPVKGGLKGALKNLKGLLNGGFVGMLFAFSCSPHVPQGS